MTLKAAGSGREVTLNAIGRPAVLLFHTQETAEQAAQVNLAVRQVEDYADPSQLLIANVVDLHAVPKLFRGFAENAMRDSYKQAASALPREANPADHVLILPDWDGNVTKSVGLKDVNKDAGVAVLDADGHIVGVSQGKDASKTTLGFLNTVR
jgi:hypothetical protein